MLRLSSLCLPLACLLQGLTALTCLSLMGCLQLVNEQEVADFTAADISAALRQLPQLQRAFMDTRCPLASWELPCMPHLTFLCVHQPWYRHSGEPAVEEGTLRRVLAQLPSVRHLVFRERVEAEVEQRIRADFPQLSFSPV